MSGLSSVLPRFDVTLQRFWVRLCALLKFPRCLLCLYKKRLRTSVLQQVRCAFLLMYFASEMIAILSFRYCYLHFFFVCAVILVLVAWGKVNITLKCSVNFVCKNHILETIYKNTIHSTGSN